MLQRLDLTNTRSVLFEKAQKHSHLIKNIIDLLDGTYYFKWPDYPEMTLFYKENKCVFQINDWFELCYLDYEVVKLHLPSPYNGNKISEQKIIDEVLKKTLKVPNHYHFNITVSLPSITTSFVKGYFPTTEEEKRNQRYADTKNLSFDEQILRGAVILGRLNDYRTDLLRGLLYKRILARH